MMSLDEYLIAVKGLTGAKVHFSNPVMRADYEDKSVKLGQWLTLTQYECSMGMI